MTFAVIRGLITNPTQQKSPAHLYLHSTHFHCSWFSISQMSSTHPPSPRHASRPPGSASPGGRALGRPRRRRCPGCWCPSWGRRWAPCSLLSGSPRFWDTAAEWTGGQRRGISSAAATRASGIWRQKIINITNSLNKHKQSLLILFKQAKRHIHSSWSKDILKCGEALFV